MPDNDDTTLRPIQAAKDAGREAIERGRGALLGWLPDRKACEECGALCDPKTEYVKRQSDYCAVWSCPECGWRCHRSERNPLRAEMWSDK